MKLKHWAGYGNVTAKKVADKRNDLHIVVTGNHERGLRRDDMYDLFNWLIKRFDKSVKDMGWLEFYHAKHPDVLIMEFEFVDPETGLDTDGCEYIFKYRK